MVRWWYALGTLEVRSWYALSTVLLLFGTLLILYIVHVHRNVARVLIANSTRMHRKERKNRILVHVMYIHCKCIYMYMYYTYILYCYVHVQ